MEVEFGDRDWVSDVGDIERDGDNVTVQLDRDYAEDADAFDELCTAVAGQVMAADIFQIERVTITNGDGDEVMRSRPDAPQCDPVAR